MVVIVMVVMNTGGMGLLLVEVVINMGVTVMVVMNPLFKGGMDTVLLVEVVTNAGSMGILLILMLMLRILRVT